MITFDILEKLGYTQQHTSPYYYLSEFINLSIENIPDIKKWVYDVECYPDFFSVTFIPADTSKQLIKKYVKADISNNIPKLVKTLRNMKCVIFVITDTESAKNLQLFITTHLLYRIGFNNIGYDDLLMGLIKQFDESTIERGSVRKLNNNAADGEPLWVDRSINEVLYKVSNAIIFDKLEYSDRNKLSLPGISLDVLKVNRLDKLGISLKKAAVAIRWYRIQDLPYSPNLYINASPNSKNKYVFNVLTYNINDVLITIAAFKVSRNEFKMRAGISKTFGVDVYSLSRSAAGDAILENKYAELLGKNRYSFIKGRTYRKAIPFVDIIDEKLSFTTPEFKALHHDLIRTTAYVSGQPNYKKFEKIIIYDNTKYKLALGGLHSVDRPMYIKSTSEYSYIDADVRSYYPNLMLNLFIHPRHLNPNIFLAVIELMLNDRLEAKSKSKDTSLSAEDLEKYFYINSGLKISINNIFGKMGYDGWLYDLRAMYKTTINGQLKLFSLIEKLYLAGIHTISANTDGIIAKVPEGRKNAYYELCHQWEKENNLSLEFTNYNRYLCTSVNDYIAVKSDGEIKRKGDFVIDISLDKGYSAPIIPIALSNWLLHNIKIEDTIHNEKNIHNFVYSQKVGSNMQLFALYIHDGKLIEEQLQSTNRYYVSNYGVSLIKRYLPENSNYYKSGKVREFALKKNEYVQIINDLPYNYSLSNVNRTFYIREAYAILNKSLRLDYKLITGTKSSSSKGGKSGISGTLFDNIYE